MAALRKGGLRGVRARDEYVRAITALAWQRHRTAPAPGSAEEAMPEVEKMYRERLRQLTE